MKLKKLILTLTLSSVLACGGLLLGTQNHSEPVKADTTYYGDIIYVDLSFDNYTYWKYNDSSYEYNCHFAFYLFDDNGNNKWSSYVSHTKGDGLLSIQYSGFTFQPTKAILLRYPESLSEGNWLMSDRFKSADKQSADLSYSKYYVGNYDSGLAATSAPVVKGGISGGVWSDLASLSLVKNNDSKHVEYYSTRVSLTSGNSFKVVYGNYSDPYYSNYSTHASISSNFSGGNGSDINVLKSGDYAFYFDTCNKSTYITTTALAESDEWAQKFLSLMVCDGNKITSNGWLGTNNLYNDLTAEGKQILYDVAEDGDQDGTYVEQAIARYDFIIKKYGTSKYNDYIGRSSKVSYPETTSNAINNINSGDSDNSTLILTLTIGLAVLSLTSLLVIKKKRKHQK